MNPRKRKRFDPLDASRPFPPHLTWYVLTVSPRREYQVQRWLEDRGWFTLCPVREFFVLANRKRSGRHQPRQKIVKPELSGIIFAGYTGPAPWLSLETAFHIRGPINCNGVPLPLPEAQVDRFRLEAVHAAKRERTRQTLKSGGKARVLGGFLEGQTLDVAKMAKNGKAAKLVAVLFGQEREVEISVDLLEAA